MCKVTFIPKGKNDFILTSSRDEAPNRISLPPNFYNVENTDLLYPEDELSGGTWIGVSKKNRLICVLNEGGEIKKRQASYQKSRGVIAKYLMVAENMVCYIEPCNFDDIEPFTLVVADWNATLKIYELVWNGNQKYFIEIPLDPEIWSSSTLYSKSMRDERLQWLEDFINENNLHSIPLLKFHKTAGEGNMDYGVVMNCGFVKTTSITQLEKLQDLIEMRHENLQNKSASKKLFNLPQAIDE